MKKHKIRMIVDKSLSQGFWKQIGLLAIFVILLLVVSYILIAISGCDWCNYCSNHDVKPWLLPIYLLIDSNALNNLYISNEPGGSVHGWMLAASSIIYIFGIFCFNGLLIGVITNYIEHRVQDYRDGLRHYLRKGHHIIMGYDDMVPSIIEDIFNKDPNGNVMILSSYDVKQINERLKKSVARDKLDQIIVNYGQKTASEYYKDIHLETAKDIYVIGYRQLPSHDAVNVECVDSICSYLSNPKFKNKPQRIVCLFEDIDTFAALKTSDIFKKVNDMNMEFIPYNFYNGWTKQVFVTRSYKEKNNPTPEHYPVIYGKGIGPNDNKYLHLVIVGSNNFASTIAIEAAHIHHFPNFEKNNSLKTRITFIDLKADKEMPLFFTRNRHFCDVQSYLYSDMSAPDAKYTPETHSELLSKDIDKHDFLDVEFEFIKGDVFAENVQELLKEWALDMKRQCLSIFLAMTDQRNNFVMGMNMPDEIYEKQIPIFIRQERADNFVTNLRKTDFNNSHEYQIVDNKTIISTQNNGRYANIYPFGMEDMAYCFNKKSLLQGKLINYIYCFLDDKSKKYNYNAAELNKHKLEIIDELKNMPEKTLWENVDKKWGDLSVANKWSNFYFADNLTCKLDVLRLMRGGNIIKDDTLTEEDLHMLAIMEHNRWNVEKLFMGFRVAKPYEDYYRIKDIKQDAVNTNKKLFIHSDIRPYDDLQDYDKYQNEMTARFIPWILDITKNQEESTQ